MSARFVTTVFWRRMHVGEHKSCGIAGLQRVPEPSERPGGALFFLTSSGTNGAKSHIVAEALAAYFARRDREELEADFAAAAADPLFIADNQAVLDDFAGLDADAELERRKR